MEKKEPILFSYYPNLKSKVPWISLLTTVPTPVDRLSNLEKYLGIDKVELYIKRDDKNNNIYGGNKLRKFEFIFADGIQKKKKGVMTFGGVGTNHGLACAIIAKNLGLKCDLFLANQPLMWHVQQSLLLFDYFGAKIHYSKGYSVLAIKGLLFRLFHPNYFLMLPGASLLFGRGNPLGTVGYINALLELNEQIKKGIFPKPDAIFVACGSTGTAAGLIGGIKLLNLGIKMYAVGVSGEIFVNPDSVMKNCNIALEYLQSLDDSIPKVKVDLNDFEIVTGYLGSDYGVKTKRGEAAVDLVMKVEGKEKGFKLETTYTGKAMAAMLDFLKKEENRSKKVLFWNTYNSNDLTNYLKDTKFNYKKLPKKLHKFFEEKIFQCWLIKNCPENQRLQCEVYLNSEYRCWNVKGCSAETQKNCEAFNKISKAIELEDA